MLIFVQCILLLYSCYFVFGGTVCPPRSDIYPCICLNKAIGKKKVETTLICHGLESDESLQLVKLQDMEIDRFLLYDSFWEMAPKSSFQSVVPVNVLNGYKITEIEIVDTTMSNFGCPVESNFCGMSDLKRFTSINSTLGERVLCNNNAPSLSLWINCPEKIEFLKIDDGLPSDTNLKPDFFPQPMLKLKELHLPNNKILRIDRRTFNSHKFPVLHTLNLTHNALKDLKSLFSSPMRIKHLDLSYNLVRYLVDFTYLPDLETLKLIRCGLLVLQENDWTALSPKIKHIDFTDNPLRCECSGFKWFNGTLPIHTAMLGSCVSPDEVKGMKLRKASRTLNERCDENGKVGSRKIKKN